jgi:uncharacterized zinc-type alcohol dehydrogenase-like protein
MLEFAVRHQIEPTIETFAFSDVNQAFDALVSQKPAHRIVLTHA